MAFVHSFSFAFVFEFANLPLAKAEAHGFSLQDPSVVFVIALLTVLTAPLIFEKLKIPGLIGLIVAGIVLGPHAVNLIPEDSLIPPLGSIGLLYLMFLVGLEIDMHRFLQERHNSIIFGLTTFLIPQTLGAVGAHYLLGLSWPASVLLASMFASHTLVPYPILQRLGLVKERVATAAAGGTVLTDTLALLVLAVIAESSRGDGLTAFFWIRQGTLFALYTGLIVWLAPRLSRWFFRWVGNVEGVTGFLYVLTFALGCAVLAPLAGLEPIIGTFLAGLTLNMLIPERSRLMIRLRFVGDILFIPFFLLSVGMRVDIELLMQSGKVWLVMAYMVAGGYITKLAAALISGKALGFSREETGVLYGLSVNQAAATLAAVMVGVRLGIFAEDILNGAILMILATCLLGPWVTERYGRRLALQAGERTLDSSGAPERIMIPVNNEQQIEPLMSLAMMLREPHSGEALYPAMMVAENDAPEKDVANAEKLLANATLQAMEAETPVNSVVRVSDNMLEELIGASRDLRISTLVMDEDLSLPSEYEHVPSRLIEEGRHLAFRFVNPCPLNLCRRMTVAVPPLIERQAGFADAWSALMRMLNQIGGNLHIIAEKATLQAMIRRSYFDPKAAHVQTESIIDFSRLPAKIREIHQSTDLTAVFLPRYGQLAWVPAHSRIPNQIKKILGDDPGLIIHPPELKWEKEPTPQGHDPLANFKAMLPAEKVFLKMDEQTVDDAVKKMVTELYPAAEHANIRKKLLDDLQLMARDASLRIVPNCVMLHSHKAAPPAAPTVLLGTRPEGFIETTASQEGENEPPQALILLLGTPEESAEEHLRRLASIASIFRDENWMDKVVNADSYEQLTASSR